MGTDGDGIRTLIILTGCPLRCKYCINPFTWNNEIEPKQYSAETLYAKILVDRPYMIATNGGITFGGGEPLLQSDLICEFREICDKEITIYVETSLNVSWNNIEKCVDLVDKFYVDIKAVDNNIYREYTGADLNVALENLRRLLDRVGNKNIIVRIPVIPEFTTEVMQYQYVEKLKDMGITEFDLFEYKKL